MTQRENEMFDLMRRCSVKRLVVKRNRINYKWVEHFAEVPIGMGWGKEEQESGEVALFTNFYELQHFTDDGWKGLPNGPAYWLDPFPLDDF